MGWSISGADHGTKLNLRGIFAGEFEDSADGAYAWCQKGGINAGIMVLAPNEERYLSSLRDVTSYIHPERIPGAGPEQDYLSRLFAPDWTHISILWNFQLHWTFHALEAQLQNGVAAVETVDSWIPERMSIDMADVLRIFHFSGHLKMWHRDYVLGESDTSFAERLLRDSAALSCRLWLDCGGTSADYAERGFAIRPIPIQMELLQVVRFSPSELVRILHIK